MTNFNQQLLNADGQLAFQGEVSTDEKGDRKVIQMPLDLKRTAKFALLDIAQFSDGMENPMNSADMMYKRYNLMKKIELDPENVELTKEEKDIFTTLLPYHYEVRLVGQIMDLLKDKRSLWQKIMDLL